MKEFAPRYLLVVDRIGNLDTLQVQVELRQEYFDENFDTIATFQELEKRLADRLKSVLSITAKVNLKSPGTLARNLGKDSHVIDHRKQY